MKHKLKKILLLFVFTGTLFVSCTTEEEVVRNENYKSKFQVREQSYQELIKVNTFKRALDKIPKQKTTTTLNGKTVMEEQYGFSIIDTPIKITETDETIAYNLLVKSDTITEGNYFENLLINIDKQTNLVKAYLVKYNLEDTNLVYTNHDSFLFNGTRSAREIIYNNSPVRTFGKESAGPCITYQILMCSYQGNHVAGEQCILNNFDLLYVQTQTSGDCSTGVDPIDTSGGIGGTTSSGGTTSNGNTNDGSINVIDNPTPSCTDCLELTAELDNFLGNLNETQLTIWNGLEYVVKRSIVSYLVQNSYSVESILFVEKLMDLSNENNATFQFDNTIDSSNQLVFNTLEDFENHLETNLATLEETDFEIDTQNQRIATAKFSYGTFGITIRVKQNMLPSYEVVNVSSVKTGLSILLSYEQTDYHVDIVGSYVNVDVVGLATTGIKINLPFEANITFEDEVHFRLVIDKNTGHLITAYEMND